MKKFLYQLDASQRRVYQYIKSEVTYEGDNLIGILTELDEGFQSIPDVVYEAYCKMNSIEKVEVIHFISKHILKNIK